MSDTVYLVFYARGSFQTFCGAFSSAEKAQKYIDGVPEAERVWWYYNPVKLDSNFV